MGCLSGIFYVVLAVGWFYSVSTNVVIYTVTFDRCIQSSTCPQGNPSRFNATFALNGTLSPNMTLNVGDQLKFNLSTTVLIHPLTICRNSPLPKFCEGAHGTDELNIPITRAGQTTSVTFTTIGSYYYGCRNHPGMGALINVTKTINDRSSP